MRIFTKFTNDLKPKKLDIKISLIYATVHTFSKQGGGGAISTAM